MQQIEGDPQQAVDRGLEHQAAHHRGDRRGRRGMRFRQPHMQRHQAGLGAEAQQREQERGAGPEGREPGAAHRVERELPASALQHAEAEQDADRADVRHQEVEEASAADFRNAVLRRHQEVGAERHRLPRDHEEVRIVGEHHHGHAGKKDVVLQAQQPGRGAFAGAEVAGGKDRDARPGDAEQQQKEAGQRIQAQVEGQIGQAERQHHDLRCLAGG